MKAQAQNMQEIEIPQTKADDLQQIEQNDNEKEKKKTFKLPKIEIPDHVKIFLFALLKQVSNKKSFFFNKNFHYYFFFRFPYSLLRTLCFIWIIP